MDGTIHDNVTETMPEGMGDALYVAVKLSAVPFLKTLANPVRLQVLSQLLVRPMCVRELEAVIGKSQPLISTNLIAMSEIGLLDCASHGRRSVYSLRADVRVQVARLIQILI